MTTVHQARRAGASLLAAHSTSPQLDADVLLGHVLSLSRTQLLTESTLELTPQQEARFRELLERRAALEPIAYIIGRKEFYGRDFVVDPRVLVPRPETELIVELALNWFQRRSRNTTIPLTIADIGTGSGCLAVTLALEVPQAYVFACDISVEALAVAQQNIERYNVSDRVQLLQGSGCAPLPGSVTLVVANPPYTILAEVDKNVYRWEPHLALDGGGVTGFDMPADLLAQLPNYVDAGGAILMEIGAWQGSLAMRHAQTAFPAGQIKLHQDLAGHNRVLEIET